MQKNIVTGYRNMVQMCCSLTLYLLIIQLKIATNVFLSNPTDHQSVCLSLCLCSQSSGSLL